MLRFKFAQLDRERRIDFSCSRGSLSQSWPCWVMMMGRATPYRAISLVLYSWNGLPKMLIWSRTRWRNSVHCLVREIIKPQHECVATDATDPISRTSVHCYVIISTYTPVIRGPPHSSAAYCSYHRVMLFNHSSYPRTYVPHVMGLIRQLCFFV